MLITRKQLTDRIFSFINGAAADDSIVAMARVISIPVCYGGEFGPDIAFVAQHNGITEDEVTAIDGSIIPISAQTICVHGDTPGAIDMIKAIRAKLKQEGVALKPFGL